MVPGRLILCLNSQRHCVTAFQGSVFRDFPQSKLKLSFERLWSALPADLCVPHSSSGLRAIGTEV